MTQIRERHDNGAESVYDVNPDLVPFYADRPERYTVVVDEAAAADLKGDALTEAAKRAGVEHPSTLTADEKRAAIVDATAVPEPQPTETPAGPADEPAPSDTPAVVVPQADPKTARKH